MAELVTAARLVGGLVLLLANGFFVTTEFALTRVRQFSKDEFDGDGGLARAWEMTDRLEIFLSGCQIGITVASVSLGVVAEPAVAAVLDPFVRMVGIGNTIGQAGHTATAVVLSLALINFLHVVIGEQVPTYLGIERTKTIARYGAPVLYWWTRLMWPFIVLADRVAKGILRLFDVDITRSWADGEEGEGGEGPPASRTELQAQMGETLLRAELPTERRREVMKALEIGDETVADIMVDADDVIALSTVDEDATNVERIRQSPHVRFPLVGETLADFRGVVYTPALIDQLEGEDDLDLAAIAAPPMTVSPETSVSDLIDRFQAERQELALVVGDGEVQGLVTVTDAMEEIVGEVEDPLDADADSG